MGCVLQNTMEFMWQTSRFHGAYVDTPATAYLMKYDGCFLCARCPLHVFTSTPENDITMRDLSK